jgi:site-specific DNA-methyltransferase (adenine-specific)
MNKVKLRLNTHNTVKPTDLMRYLCRLITPPNGIVLDPFMGSGSTGKAAMLEGFRFIGFELSPEYAKIARARIQYALDNRVFLLRDGKAKQAKPKQKTTPPPAPLTRGLFENTPKRRRA